MTSRSEDNTQNRQCTTDSETCYSQRPIHSATENEQCRSDSETCHSQPNPFRNKSQSLEEEIDEIITPGAAASAKEDDLRSLFSYHTMKPDFHARFRATMYPLPTEDVRLREAIPVLTKVTPPGIALTEEEVNKMFDSREDDAFLDYKLHAICDPKDGDVYLFNFRNQGKTYWMDNIKKDTYRWKANTNKNVGGENFMTYKAYMVFKDETGKDRSTAKFTKYMYYDLQKKRCIVHYTGDDNARQREPHGNNQNASSRFISTLAQVKVN